MVKPYETPLKHIKAHKAPRFSTTFNPAFNLKVGEMCLDGEAVLGQGAGGGLQLCQLPGSPGSPGSPGCSGTPDGYVSH